MILNLALVIILVILIIVVILIMKYRFDVQAARLRKRRYAHYLARKEARDRRERHYRVNQPRPEIFSAHFEPPVQIKIPVKSSIKDNAKPTFERHPELGSCAVDDSYRFEVKGHRKSMVDLPKNFSAIKQWEGKIVGVFDQERCGVCWGTTLASCFTDRIRIKSNGTKLQDGDYISPWHLAACMKCGTNNVCPKVCEGNYLDDVFQYAVDHGAISQHDIDKHSSQGTEYLCMDYKAFGIKPHKAKSKYRVNILPPGQLNTPENLALNENAIMQEIFEHGTVGAIIQVFVPPDSRNFYAHQQGVYGYGWKALPKETDGYHAITVLGWGVDEVDGKEVKYWIIRNSWSDKWGSSGFAKILRGANFGMIESDVWGLEIE